MWILGLNAYHGDASACLIQDGRLVAAAEEERFRRIKHWAGLPVEAVRYCLAEAGLRAGDIQHVAVNRKPGVNRLRRLAFVLRHRPSLSLVRNRLRNLGRVRSVEDSLTRAFPGETWNAQVHHVEHHLAHLASAFLASPHEEAVCLSVDGFGDFASAAWGMGRKSAIQIDGRVYFPHSLGIFYSALTQFIGFPYYGDEYKVMGLAPYGEPRFMKEMRELVRIQVDGRYELNLRYFRHHTENVAYAWNDCAPEIGCLFATALEELLGPARKPGEPLEQRHKDIARSVQAHYEEAFFALLENLHSRYLCPTLALSGGCAMNSVANGKVYQRSPFRQMYLPAAAGDAGGAIGSALCVWHGQHPQAARFHMDHAYWGPQVSDPDITALLRSREDQIRSEGCDQRQAANDQDLCRQTAEAISQGKVVGWFQGRMEWGPRALGNRSIVCDPRRPDMKAILNLKIKRRESFRPFAPSILREDVAEWFETEDDVPFMMSVFQIRPEKRALIPAVTHVDGSGRLQTVHRNTNPLYHQLIEEFRAMTGVPMVLNTSFNENEPVVCHAEEALDCFLRTRMDWLVLGNWILSRQ